jgi:hypothetical protein
MTFDSFRRKRGVISNTGLIGSFSYDLLNRLTSVYWNGLDGAGGNWNFTENLTYNALTGNIDQQAREFGKFTYSFDPLDQLTKTQYIGQVPLAQAANRSVQYDWTGNRVQDSLNGEGDFIANFLLADQRTFYQPDANGLGNLAQKTDRATGAIQKFS